MVMMLRLSSYAEMCTTTRQTVSDPAANTSPGTCCLLSHEKALRPAQALIYDPSALELKSFNCLRGKDVYPSADPLKASQTVPRRCKLLGRGLDRSDPGAEELRGRSNQDLQHALTSMWAVQPS